MYTALVLAQENGAPGTPEAPAEGNGGNGTPLGGGLGIMIPFLLILVLMYFIMLRPQRKQEKKRLGTNQVKRDALDHPIIRQGGS